jgi:hypothetical protein
MYKAHGKLCKTVLTSRQRNKKNLDEIKKLTFKLDKACKLADKET